MCWDENQIDHQLLLHKHNGLGNDGSDFNRKIYSVGDVNWVKDDHFNFSEMYQIF